MKALLKLLLFTTIMFSTILHADTYNDFSVSLTSAGYSNTGTVKSNDIGRYTITLAESGAINISLTDLSGTVFFDVSNSAMPDKTTHTLTSYGPVNYTAGDVFYLSISAPGQLAVIPYTLNFTLGGRPIANDKNYQVDVNTELIGNIITDSPADSDPDGDPISLLDHNATFLIAPDGNFTYTPALNFCGIYSFDYNITDDKNTTSNTATITINVQNAPIALDDYFVTAIDQTLNANVLHNDGGLQYTVIQTSDPLHGTIADGVDSNGSFTYVPTAGFSGVDSFTYSVTDGACSTMATATAYILVTDMCEDAVPLTVNPCSSTTETNTTTVIAGTPQAYYFTLPAEAVLDINISNTGQKELQYDFQEANCAKLFTSGTTSYLPQGDAIDIVKIYPQATYFLGFNVAQVSTTVEYSICYDTNLSGAVGSFVNSGVGVNEIGVDYDTDKNITTKVVNKPFGVRASYLNAAGEVATYDGSFGKKTVDMSVILSLAENDCTQLDVIGRLAILHDTNHTDMAADAITIDYAAKIRRFSMTSFDFGALFRAAAGLQCSISSLDSSLCLVPACFNSSDNIKAVFPPAFYPHVNVCVNGDGTPGTLAPCDSNAYLGACGGKKGGETISPLIYNIDLGCAACLADAFEGEPCSKDNFAIRPKAFDVNITDGDTFIAGKATNLKFEATDWNDNTPTTNYNENEDTSFAVDINFTDLTKNCPVTIGLEGPVQFTDGIDTDNFHFTDIGKDLNFTIHEKNGTVAEDSEFAFVDRDDTNDTDRLITPFERNITILPDHFDIEANLTDHNSDNDLTYLHDINRYDSDDNYSMAAELTINIQAKGADDNITQNYMETCYAQETILTLDIADTDITYPGYHQALNQFLYYNPTEDNGSIDSGEKNDPLPAPDTTNEPIVSIITITDLDINNTEASFPADAPDGNGTTRIEYKLNFDRKQNLVVNPFTIVLTDVNISDDDNVTGSATETAGTALLDQNATMYYARTRSSKFFYDDVTDSSVDTPIAADVYCDLGFTVCLDIGIDVYNAQINEINWWLSLGHDASTFEDGNITLLVDTANIIASPPPVGTPAATVAPTNVRITSGGIDKTVEVTATSAHRPMTVPIELVHRVDTDTSSVGYGMGASPYTNHWLIYNETSATEVPSPFYKVLFRGLEGWAGHGKTGHVVDSNSSTKKNRRLGW